MPSCWSRTCWRCRACSSTCSSSACSRPRSWPPCATLIKRRQGGESIAYLTGRKEFWKSSSAVDARVLVPRPDTETLIEEALARLGEPDDGGRPSAARRRRRHRLGRAGDHAGQGARRRGGARSDVSPGALEVARANAERLGAAVTFVEGDLAAPLAAHAPFTSSSRTCRTSPPPRSRPAARRPHRARAGARRRPGRAGAGAAAGRRRARAARAGGGWRSRWCRPGGGDAALLEAAGFADIRTRRISPASNASSLGPSVSAAAAPIATRPPNPPPRPSGAA